jgi:TolB-like protein/Flp pilus assembly protein TadD
MVGYSRLMAADEAGTLARQKAHRTELIDPKITEFSGRVVKTTGDGVLVEFPSVVDALRCAVTIQLAIAEREAATPEENRITYRIGINLGDIIVEDDDIYGDGVNVAARLEALAEPGGIFVSRTVVDHVKGKVASDFEDLGAQEVKNIPEPVHIFRVLMVPEEVGGAFVEVSSTKWWKRPAAVIAVAGIILMIAATGLIVWRPWLPDVEPASVARMALPLPAQPSIAVLPFDNLSDDPEQEYLADGLTEEIITTLSKTPELFVIARNSTFTYKGKAVPVKQVAEEQGVRYVLEGSVQRSGDRIRINAQLIDALKGNHVWAERYDREFSDLFSLQDDITHNVAIALQVTLTLGEEVRSRRRGTSSPEAFQLAHKALWHIQQYNKEDTAKARDLVKRAQEIAPDALFPLQMEGWIHLDDARFGDSASKEGSLQKAEAIARRALLIDENDPDSHLLLAGVERGRRNLDQAIRHMERAIELNPNHAKAVGAMAQLLNYSGRPEDAIAYSRKAMRLSPVYPPWMPANLGLSYMMIGEYDKAIAAYEEVLSRGAFIVFGYERLVAIYALKGDLDKAREYASELLEAKPDFTIEEWSNVLLYTNKEDLDRELDALRVAGLPERPPLELPDQPSIAVLPFTNMSDDPSQEYFADGMTEDLITDLSKISGLFVIARNSSFTYKGQQVKVRQVAKELRVRYVLEGSVRRAGDEVRINAQLIDATTGGHLWAERYDGTLTDVFDLQDRVTAQIIEALTLEITPQEARRKESLTTDNVAAHDAYLLGLSYYYRRTPEGFAEAQRQFEKAIDLDPDYAYPYAALAKIYAQVDSMTYSRALSINRLDAAARARAELTKAEAWPTADLHVVRSWLALNKHQHEVAIAEAEQALELNPNDVDALEAIARAQIYAGHPEVGLAFIDRVIRQNPILLARPFLLKGLAAFSQGDLEGATLHIERAFDLGSEEITFNGILAASYALLGRMEAAREAFAVFRGSRWGESKELSRAVVQFPFADDQILARLAEGLELSGAKVWFTRDDGGYLKVTGVNRLRGAEIEKLLSGQEIEGKLFWNPNPWQRREDRDGTIIYTGVPIQASLVSDVFGVSQVKDDMICEDWPEVSDVSELCSVVFRIPEGNARVRWGDYAIVTDTGPHPFRLVE